VYKKEILQKPLTVLTNK